MNVLFVIAALGGLILLILVVMAVILATRYKKTRANEAMIVTGRARRITKPDGTREVVRYRVVRDGTFVWPVIEQAQTISLEPLDVGIGVDRMRTAEPVLANVEVEANAAIKSDDESIHAASERFLSMERDRITDIVRRNLEGHLRAVTGQTTPEELENAPEDLASRVRAAAEQEMAQMGLEILSLSVRSVEIRPQGE
jgi:flotillin